MKKEEKSSAGQERLDKNFIRGKKTLLEIDPRAPLSDHFRASVDRIDGIAMYIAVGIFLITAIVVSLKIALSDSHSGQDWTVLFTALCMTPVMVILYFNFDIFSTGTRFSRIKNALLLGITGFGYSSFL